MNPEEMKPKKAKSEDVTEKVMDCPKTVKVIKGHIINAKGQKEYVQIPKRQFFVRATVGSVFSESFAEYLWKHYRECVEEYIPKKVFVPKEKKEK